LLAVAQAFGVMPAEQEARLRGALAVARSKGKIDAALNGKQWAELASLTAADPGAWPASAGGQVQTAFNDAVAGTNTQLAREIAAVLDCIDPEGAGNRRLALDEQQKRQAAATAAWVEALPAQIQALLRAGAYPEARALIAQAQPFLQEDSTAEGFLNRAQQQLDEFEAIKSGLDEVRVQLNDNAIGLEEAERQIAPLKDRISRLVDALSPESTAYLIDEANALTSAIFLKGAALELNEVGRLIDQRRLNEASASLEHVKAGLLTIPEQQAGRAAAVAQFNAVSARLDNALKDGDRRPWLESNAKLLLAVLGALAVLLLGGLIATLLLASRNRDELAQVQLSLGTAEAEYAGSRSTVSALMTPSVADMMTAEAFNSLMVQATANADTLATYAAIVTQEVDANVELAEALATVQTTPEPLALSSQLLGPAPITSTVSAETPVFYEQPAALIMAAPPGWQFQIEPNQPLRIVNGNGTVWNLRLNYGQIISDAVKSEVEAFVPSSAVSEDLQGSGGLRLDLTQIISGLWHEPGHYRLNWAGVADNGLRTDGASPLYFEIAAPPRVQLIASGGFRSRPAWDAQYLVPRPSGEVFMEVLGQIDLTDALTEQDIAPPTPDFLMVRLPGERTIYWLPSWNAVEYDTADWPALLAKLPPVTAPPEDNPQGPQG
jgi:hypothetical protein